MLKGVKLCTKAQETSGLSEQLGQLQAILGKLSHLESDIRCECGAQGVCPRLESLGNVR